MLSEQERAANSDPAFTQRVALTVKEAAARLRYSDSTVYDLFRDGELEGYKKRGIRIYADSVEEFKARNSNKKTQTETLIPRILNSKKGRRPKHTNPCPALKFL